MAITKDVLIDEIVKNAREDRARLVDVADGLKKIAERKTMADDGESEAPKAMDPDVAMALSEDMSRISDSLTKIQQQLVELVKVGARRPDDEEAPRKLSGKQRESVYEEMEKSKSARPIA